jgi:hypothetical protein
MIKLGGIISRNAFVNEAESDKYTHIGYGMYKQKGKEKDKDAPTFKKDGEKYVPVKSGNAEKGGDTSAGDDKPKVNIFDKPKEKQPTKSEPETDTLKVHSTKLKDMMPKSDHETFSGKSTVSNLSPESQREVSMKIDKLDELAREAKQKGEDAPNYNLCKITIEGTNLYCDNNLGIPREEMPQFKGKPTPGSPASKMELDKNGNVDTEPVFKEMLKKKGIKTAQTKIPSDALKATQSELVGTKVAGMAKALEKDPNNPGITAPIYVSRDGYVIDGHHRWAAVTSNAIKQGKPANMEVIVIDEDAKNIIPMANKFAEEIGVAAKKADTNQETQPTDSTNSRPGHPETNKFTRTLAKKTGMTPQKLGKDEYKKRMIQSAYSALTDSNYSAEARKLIATIEGNPELEKEVDWSKGPSMADPDFQKKNKEFLKNTAFGSEFANGDSNTEKFGSAISDKAGWDGQEAVDAIAYDLKMNGFKDLASKIQSIFEGRQNETKLTSILGEDTLVNREIAHYTGTRHDAVGEFIEKNNIDGEKLVKFIRKGSLKDRMSFVSAIAGKPGNPVQKAIISKFSNKK